MFISNTITGNIKHQVSASTSRPYCIITDEELRCRNYISVTMVLGVSFYLTPLSPRDIVPLDPFPFEYSKDATKFMGGLDDSSFSFGVFDPPYSPRQLKECYKGKGEYDTKSSTWSNWKNLLSKKIKQGGLVISFGWNSNGMGLSRGFKIIEILLVAHGGMHNDTICLVEKKA